MRECAGLGIAGTAVADRPHEKKGQVMQYAEASGSTPYTPYPPLALQLPGNLARQPRCAASARTACVQCTYPYQARMTIDTKLRLRHRPHLALQLPHALIVSCVAMLVCMS